MGEQSAFWKIYGLTSQIVNGIATKKALRGIHAENMENQGIMHYRPSQIEAFFDAAEPIGNMVFSGIDAPVRIRAIVRAAACAWQQGYAVVILHASDRALEAFLSSQAGNAIELVNAANPVYDPFIGQSDDEIARLILSSAGKGHPIQSIGKYYLDGIGSFIRAKGIQPYCQMYVTCPHLTLIDKVNAAEAAGQIGGPEANRIISQLMQGASERGNIERFFSEFASQCRHIVAVKSSLNQAVNLRSAASQQEMIAVDAVSDSNGLLINMLVSEMNQLLAVGMRLFVVIDNIQVSANEALQELARKSGTNCCLLISADDAFASFGADESLFYSVIGKASKIVLSRHASAHSCQKWSDIIGSYDKKDVNSTFAQNASYYGRPAIGAAQSASVTIRRENIVKSEEILRMHNTEAYIVSRANGELAHTFII